MLLHVHITNLTEFLSSQSHLWTQQSTEFYEIHSQDSWHRTKPSQGGSIWSTLKHWARSSSKAHCKAARESLRTSHQHCLQQQCGWFLGALWEVPHIWLQLYQENHDSSFFSNFRTKKKFLLEKLITSTVKERNFWQMKFLASPLLCSNALKRGTHADAQLPREN